MRAEERIAMASSLIAMACNLAMSSNLLEEHLDGHILQVDHHGQRASQFELPEALETLNASRVLSVKAEEVCTLHGQAALVWDFQL